MMKDPKVVVPIDFSEPSRRALRAAGHWVRIFGGQITPLHAYEAITDLDGFHFYGGETSICGDLPTVERGIKALLDDVALQDVDAEHVADAVVVTGEAARCIAEVALDHDLIITASHGRTGFSRLFLGSVTEDLIRLSPVPVLIVADETALRPMDRILVTTDLSLNSEAAFPFACRIAETTGAAIEALYVHTGEEAEPIATEELEHRVRAFLQPHFGKAAGSTALTVLVTRGLAREAIQSFVGDETFSLVIMATVGKGATEHHRLGNVPAHVVREVKTALLLVNPEHQGELRRLGLNPRKPTQWPDAGNAV